MPPTLSSPLRPRIAAPALALAVALHAVALWTLVRLNGPGSLVVPPTLQVELIAPTPLEQPKPAIAPPKPQPIERRSAPRPVPEAPRLAVPRDIPAAVETPAAVSPTHPSAPTVPLAPSAPPAEVVKPRFDADYLDNPKPVYPALSRRLGETGQVVLRVAVSAAGLPTDVSIHATSGSDRLDRAALEAVRRWKFVPARQGQEPIAASVLVPIAFSLKD